MRVTSGGLMRSASDGSRGAASTLTPVSWATQYSSMWACEVGLVGVLPLEGVEDRVLRAQPQGGGDLAELQVEVDDAHPLAACSG